jgi:hypothetical protein
VPEAAVRNHTVSQCYLDRWARDGYVTVVLGDGRRRPARPKTVGFTKNFWGPDEALRVEVEQRLSLTEGPAAETLRQLPDAWPFPPGHERWRDLLLFIGLHLVRSPKWLEGIQDMAPELILRRVPEWSRSMPPEAVDHVVKHLLSEAFRTELMMGQIPKMASMLGCMNCTVLEAPRPWLMVGDHPVVVVPLLKTGEAAPMQLVPDGGLLETVEVRFPIDARRALLFSWLDQPHREDAVEIGYDHAVNLNRSQLGQVASQWYMAPDSRPPFVVPPFLTSPASSLAPKLLDGYAPRSARVSRRRQEAMKMLDRLIEGEITDRVETITVTRRS